jgi:diguanylate cyclase (GGDEF)-like protein
MDLSARRVAVACILPVILVTLLASAWAGWYVGEDRGTVAELGGQASLQASTTEALSALSSEVYALDGLGALPDDVPDELAPYLTDAMELAGSGRTFLELADRRGAEALERLDAADAPLRDSTRRALARMEEEDLARAAVGRMPAGTSVNDYADAITELQASFASAPASTQAAVDALVRLGESPSPWQRPGFVGALAALWLVTIAAAALIGRSVARRLRRAGESLDAERARMEELRRRNGRLLEIVDASRRVASGTDMESVADAVAAEAAALLDAPAAAVYLLDGAVATPVGSAGDLSLCPIDAGGGILGRALDTGAPALGVVSSDPALPGMSPVAVLAAPLIAGRRIMGAIVVGREAGAPLDDQHAMELRLIGLAAATAIEGARAHRSATALAFTDALTGLGNRRRLDDDLARACAPGAPRPVGLVMIDVDHFKSYNDTHGHPAGDEVLRGVSAIVAANVREQDVVYRFGGEELCAILPGAGPAEAAHVAERVRAAVAAHTFPGGSAQPGGRVTVSAGVACEDGPEGARLMAAADAALYRAKREGRDRVVTAA